MRLMLRFLGLLFAAGTILFVVAICAAAGLLWHYSKSLPDYSQLQDYEPAVMTRVHAADGSLLAEYSKERRLYLPSKRGGRFSTNASTPSRKSWVVRSRPYAWPSSSRPAPRGSS